jgi:hypothetical protein
MLPIATEFCGAAKLRDVPLATNAPQQIASLFNRLIGGDQQAQWDGQWVRASFPLWFYGRISSNPPSSQ